MIKKVTVINYLGESLEMPLENPYDCGFAICSISGLGPVKANINTTDLATDDGSVFNSARALKRNITMSLKFFESSQRTVEDVRQSSYRYFPLKKPLTLIVETDNRLAYCTGYVESNEPDIFSSDERANISIICPDPWFYEYGGSGGTIEIFSNIHALFEFEFPSIEGQDELEFGEYDDSSSGVLNYEGDVEVGAIITMHMLGNATGIEIFNNTTHQLMSINTDVIATIMADHGGALKAADDIIICTEPGRKGATLRRGGFDYNILNALGINSDWIYLVRGGNLLGFNASSGEENIQMTVESEMAYEGV